MPGEQGLARVPASSGPQILTVSALARSVRDLLEHRYPLLWVAGEISNFTLAKSGHAYFMLKDDQAQARCVMFRSRQQLLEWEPREGMQVEAQVLVSLYEARGEFQLNVETLRRAGLGARFEAFVKLRDKLEREGLFDAAAKRPLPAFPRTVGVITSRDAAALRDVLTTLRRRNPSIAVVLYPVSVQGNRAGEEIVAAARREIERRMVHVDQLARRLVHPGARLRAQADLLAQLRLRLGNAAARLLVDRQAEHLLARLRVAAYASLERAAARCAAAGASLSHLDPGRVLERGYSIVQKPDGRVVSDSAALALGESVVLRFAKGGAEARIETTRAPDKPAAA